MKKIRNEFGFGAIEILLTLIAVILIVFVGWYIYHTDHKTSTTTSNSTSASSAANPYDGWQSYSDSYFNFKYPDNWTVQAPGTFGFGISTDASITGVQSSMPSYMYTADTNGKEALNFSFNTSLLDPSGCNQTSLICTVRVVTPLATKGVANPKLIVYSEHAVCPSGAICNPTDLSNYEVIDSSTVKVGNTSFAEGITAGSKTDQLEGCEVTFVTNGVSGDQECATITDYSAFQSSSDYKNLVNLLNSLTIQ